MGNPNHVHVYALKGGPTFWAECECGDKLNEGSGVVAGAQAKVMRAIARSLIPTA